LESWFDELFYRALDWLYKGNHELAIETTRMGMVSNVLGHLSQEGDAEGPGLTKQNFLLAICRGLGGNVSEEDRAMLTREAFKWANENIPDPSQPLHCQVVESLIVGYQQMSTAAEISLEDVQRSSILPPLVPTATVLRNMDLFATWLAHEQPFIVSGPEGSGKNLLIRHAIQRLQNESDTALNVAVLNCNAQTTSKDCS
jgi:dynein heavy chain 2